MCGILVTISPSASESDVLDGNDLLDYVASRGPDYRDTYKVLSVGECRLTFTSSVLHLRGQHVVKQPVVGETGNVLCWNGEVWSGLDVSAHDCDTSALFQALEAAAQTQTVHQVFERLRGPYAFTYYQVHFMFSLTLQYAHGAG